jgi:heme-degrading monooxygenase HmoA
VYSRVVSFIVRPDTCELTREIIHEKIVPALRKQRGLVDLLILQSSSEPNQFLAITLWQTKDHAENYHRDVYSQLAGMLEPYIDGNFDVRFFTVDTSSFHHIAEGRVAA